MSFECIYFFQIFFQILVFLIFITLRKIIAFSDHPHTLKVDQFQGAVLDQVLDVVAQEVLNLKGHAKAIHVPNLARDHDPVQ